MRRQIRHKRRSLNRRQQAHAARQLFLQLRRHPNFIFAKRLAFYIAIDGEIDPRQLLQLAHEQGKECYLPVIRKDRSDELLFVRYDAGNKLHKNHYTLSEPVVKQNKTVPAWSLDTVFVPLVGFDASGSRLGMGKGYYDRTFAFLKTFARNSPTLIGIAHECQKVDKLDTASWDVPLERIVTDRQIYQTD